MKRFRSISRTKKSVAVGATLALTLGIAGAAFAFYTSTGTGNGWAGTGSPTHWGVTVSNDTSYSMYPGFGSEVLTYTITNQGTAPQQLTSVTGVVASDPSNGYTETGQAHLADRQCRLLGVVVHGHCQPPAQHQQRLCAQHRTCWRAGGPRHRDGGDD